MKKIFTILIFVILQSCYFGAGLVEKEIAEDYFLFANNTLDEMSIWLSVEEHYNHLVVPETVFAVGKNRDFIIAKSHPQNLESGINKSVTFYHIIELRKKLAEKSPNLTLEQFKQKRIELKIPNNLEFEIIFKELD